MGKVVKRKAIVFVVGAVVLLGVAGVGLSLMVRTLSQPLAFNHRLHIEDMGMECTDCHLYAETGVRATIPNIRVCVDCHEEALTDSPVEARLVELIEAEELIPWRKVYWVPDHVYFSHRRHTAIAGIDCTTCHGAMQQREQPVVRREVPITMERCIACHTEAGASNDCLLCHR